MLKITFTFLLIAFSPLSWADTAKCTINIEDVNAGTKYKVEKTFTFKAGAEAQRKHFALPGSGQFSCTLAFFDFKTGTMLSCQLDEVGHNFVQSDRSNTDESLKKNNLSFRYKSSHYVLKSNCN